MNPEFERNVWLELTPLRLIVMAAVLALAFFAAALSGDVFQPGQVARWGFYFIVVLWGTRNAARSVIGEIRERTWDAQRLSSLSAGTMMGGKLFGSTIFSWYGGLICLAVIAADTLQVSGILPALHAIAYYIALGVITQSVSFWASLIAVSRKQGRSSFEVFLYQAAGIVAGIAVADIADPAMMTAFAGHLQAQPLWWWGMALPVQAFLLVSLALFAGWTLVAGYRQMRLELKLVNGPLVWLGFLLFIAVYVSGFSGYAMQDLALPERHLISAALTIACLTYAAVLLEPKSRVVLRWLGNELKSFHVGAAVGRLPCWMISYLTVLPLTIALLVLFGLQGAFSDLALTGSVLGFLTRDIGIVVLLNMLTRRRGGDIAAIAILVVLYALLPAILAGLHYESGRALFLPLKSDPLWLSPAAAWFEAIVVWAMAVSAIRLTDEQRADG